MTAKAQILIDKMALVLVETVAELGSDEECIQALIGARFASTDISDYLDVARDIARGIRLDEAELWYRLNEV